MRIRAVRMPFQASRSTLSSCKPLFLRMVLLLSAGRPTPRDGGMKPGGGALIADGAIRECLICANEDLMATWIDCYKWETVMRNNTGFIILYMETHIQALEVFTNFQHKLFGSLFSLWKTVLCAIRLR